MLFAENQIVEIQVVELKIVEKLILQSIQMFILLISFSMIFISAILFFDNVRFGDEIHNLSFLKTFRYQL
jgi:cell division protein FtsL